MEFNGLEMEERLLEFAVRVGKLVNALPETPLGRHICSQLIRSGTSPVANYSETCAAESKKDFIYKLGIVLKELRETRTWIRLIVRSDLLPENRISTILDECEQLGRIIGKSIVTSKQSIKKS